MIGQDPCRQQKVRLNARDGHEFTAWRSEPPGMAKGGIVILHAVFGLTDHLGDVCRQWAAAGYSAIAPSLFDRRMSGVVHLYGRAGADSGIRSYAELDEQEIFSDIAACEEAMRAKGKVAISGFCTGGTWAWRASGLLPFDAQVNFYGSHIHQYPEIEPLCPTIVHYGDSDAVVPLAAVEGIIAAHPNLEIVVHPGAGHAFFNPEQDHFDPIAARRAWDKSVEFMDRHVAG